MKVPHKPKLLGLIPLFLFIALLSAQSATLPPAIERAIRGRIDAGVHVGIVVGIIDSTGPRYFSFGRRSAQSSVAVDEDTVFEIGSISKVFTSILLADMVEKGGLSLEQPIQKVVPESIRVPAHSGKAIRFVDLATHTSGLPRLPDNLRPSDPENPYADYSPKQMFDFLSRHQLRRAPGSEYEYSNYAAGLLGYLLGLKAGTDYPSLVEAVITTPLKMTRTATTMNPEMFSLLALGHRNSTPVKNWDIPTLAGAGALRSTARDMLSFLAANLQLQSTDLDSALQLTHQPRVQAGRGMEVGLGWHIRSGNQGRSIVWHNGGTGGYRSFAGFDRKQKRGVVLLSNSDESVDDLGFYILDRSFPLRTVRPSIAAVVSRVIKEEGIAAAAPRYHELRTSDSGGSDFSEAQLNGLGYRYLRSEQVDAALVVFQLTVNTYPKSSNAYDSLAEAYMKKGAVTQAILNYIESLKLNPSNQNAREKLREMGMDPAHIGSQ